MNDRSYSKLFSSIVTSSMWSEDSDTRVVWVTMLAVKNEHSEVQSSVPGLARLANVALEKCQFALDKFKSADPFSRTKAFDGRRIEEIPGGWRILNGDAYRRLMSQDERREYKRVKEAERRARKHAAVDNPVDNECPRMDKRGQNQAEADTEADTDSHSHTSESGSYAERPGLEEVKAHSQIIGLIEWKAVDWFNEMEACGWLDNKGRAVEKWRPMLARVKMFWEADGRPMAPKGFNSQIPGNQSPQSSKPNGAQIVVLNDELRRIDEKLKSIRDSYADHQTWSERDKKTVSEMKAKRLEIRGKLGL